MVIKGLDALLLLTNDIYWDMGFANLRWLTQSGSKIGSFALFFHDEDPIVWNAVAHMNRPTNLHLSTQDAPAMILAILLTRPLPLILLVLGIFYLWVYARNSSRDLRELNREADAALFPTTAERGNVLR